MKPQRNERHVTEEPAFIKRWTTIFAILGVVSLVATILPVGRLISKQTSLEQERRACEKAIHAFLAGSDALTNAVFRYADTLDSAYMFDYWNEVNAVQSRERAAADLKRTNLSAEETVMLDNCCKLSNDLMFLETYAMRLLAESESMPKAEMPRVVADYSLTPQETALTADAKRAMASATLFGREYTEQKDTIVRGVQEFSYHLNLRYATITLDNLKLSWLLVISGVSVFLTFGVLYGIAYRRAERARAGRLLREMEETRLRNEYFHVAVSQFGGRIAKYDIASKSCKVETSWGEMLTSLDVQSDSVMEIGRVAAESAETFQSFFARIDGGESPLSADMLFIAPDNADLWYRLNATTLFSSEGKPQIAVITYFDCMEQRLRELAYARFQRERDSLPMDRIAIFERNLTKGIYEGESGGLLSLFAGLPRCSFDQRTQAHANLLVHPKDRAAFILFLNRERLIGVFHDGVFSDSMDYRMLHPDGSYRWMRYEVQLVPYPDSNDIKFYAIISDIDEEKRRELALIEQSEHDVMTGTLNRATFIKRVTESITSAPNEKFAIFLSDLDGFKTINDTFGHNVGDDVLISFAKSVQAILRTSDLFGRIGGDEFMICLRNLPNEAAVIKKAEQLCAAVRKQLSAELRVTVSVGVAVYPVHGETFESLYKRADIALYSAKQTRDGYAVYTPDMHTPANAMSNIDAHATCPD